MPPRPLQITVGHEGAITVMHISGPVDSETIEQFKAKLDEVSAKAGALVLMDCTDLMYLNSRAIGMLLKAYRQIAFGRGRLALFGVNKKLVRTLDLLHLGKELLIYETREEAIAALG